MFKIISVLFLSFLFIESVQAQWGPGSFGSVKKAALFDPTIDQDNVILEHKTYPHMTSPTEHAPIHLETLKSSSKSIYFYLHYKSYSVDLTAKIYRSDGALVLTRVFPKYGMTHPGYGLGSPKQIKVGISEWMFNGTTSERFKIVLSAVTRGAGVPGTQNLTWTSYVNATHDKPRMNLKVHRVINAEKVNTIQEFVEDYDNDHDSVFVGGVNPWEMECKTYNGRFEVSGEVKNISYDAVAVVSVNVPGRVAPAPDIQDSVSCRIKDWGDVWSNWSAWRSWRINSKPVIDQITSSQTVYSNEPYTVSCSGKVTGSISSYKMFKNGSSLGNISTYTTTAPDVSSDTDIEYSCKVTDDDGHSSDLAKTVVHVIANVPPEANAGPDIRVNANQSYTINGSATDQNDTVVAYQWSNHTGDSGDLSLSPTNAASTGFTAPATATGGQVYKLKFRAKDSIGVWSDYDYMNVVANFPPIASGSVTEYTSEGETVDLLGNASHDDERDPVGSRVIIGYAWEQISGTPVTIQNPNSANASFITPPPPASEGDLNLQFRLTVTDIDGGVDSTIVEVRINRPPTMDEFPKQVDYRDYYLMHESSDNSYYDLKMSATNPDDLDFNVPGFDEELTIEWTYEKVNAGDAELFLTYDPQDENGKLTISTNDVTSETDFVVTATITDKYGLSVSETFDLKVNVLPEFILTGDELVHEFNAHITNIENDFDANGSIISKSWVITDSDGTIFSQAQPINANQSFTFTSEDISERKYVTVTATLTDDMGGTVSKSKQIIVNARPEVAVNYLGSVMPDGTYFLPEPGSFSFDTGVGDVSPETEMGTFDVDGNVADFKWELIEGDPSLVTWEVSGPDTQENYQNLPGYSGGKEVLGFTSESGQRWVWKLTAEDNDGGTSSDTFALYINHAPEFEMRGDAISLRYGIKGFAEVYDLVDQDGTIKSIEWRQTQGPTVNIVSHGEYIEFTSFYKLSGDLAETLEFSVRIKDDLGSVTEKTVSFPVKDDFYGCGDTQSDSDNPPGGSCIRDTELKFGVPKQDSCSTLTSELWIPTDLDTPTLRSEILNSCSERNSAECKICIPPPIEDRYEECQLLPYMMPPRMKPYYLNSEGKIVPDSDLSQGPYEGQPHPSDDWNPANPENDWGMTREEYEAAYRDKDLFPAARCLDLSQHEHDVATSTMGLTFMTGPEVVAGAIEPLDIIPCWSWDLMYRCTEPVVNTCEDWSDENSFIGNAPAQWHLKGRTDTLVDNYLYWLGKEQNAGIDVDGVPMGSILQQKILFTANERWSMSCFNKETGEPRQDLANTFCPVDETDPYGGPLLSECLPGDSQRLISLGAMPIDAEGNVVDQSIQRCMQHIERVPECQYDAIPEILTALDTMTHADYSDRTMVTLEAEAMIIQPACALDLNNDGSPVTRIKDNPYVLGADWEDLNTPGEDDCYVWEADWLFYSGEQFQWCTLSCSDGTQGVHQELIDCELIDPTMEPIPEWEQWGPGWSQCSAPVIRTICPADADVNITIGGEPGGEGDLNGMICSDPVGYQEMTETGKIIEEQVVMECYDDSESVATCIPDPNCELVSVENTDLKENGLFENQYQEYVCHKTMTTCEVLVEKEICNEQEDFLLPGPEDNNFARALQASKTLEAVQQGAEIRNNEITIFAGDALKCEPWTSDAVALYNTMGAVIVALSAVSGGIAGAIAAVVGAAELLSSQEYLEQKKQCCNVNPEVVGKRVNVNSIVSEAINSILGSESQGKIPACSGEEIKLSNARWKDNTNGNIINGTFGPFYYEGSAMRRDGVMSPGTQKGMTLNLLLSELTLTRKAKWCAFDNVLARIIQMNGRKQLNELAVAGEAGATNKTVNFSVMGTDADYGWKVVDDDVNGNKMAVYQWNPQCFTERSNEDVQRGLITCPYDFSNVWTAYCSAGSDCDFGSLKKDPVDLEDDWDPRLGLTEGWDILNQRRTDDTLSAMSQFVVKKGTCDEFGQCNWDLFAWPASGASTNINFDMEFPAYSVEGGYTDSFAVADKMRVKFNVPALGETLGDTISMQYEVVDDELGLGGTIALPINISDVEGITLPNTSVKVYGGCQAETRGCGFRFVIPVSVSAIPNNSCQGFTIEQLMVLDFSKMDFGEYINSLVANIDEGGMTPEELENLTLQMASVYTNQVMNGEVISNEGEVVIGTFSDLKVTGPQNLNLEMNQELPFNLGSMTSMDVDWGDGSEQDTGITFSSLMELWDERKSQSINEYNNICVPRWDAYLVELDNRFQEKEAAWNDFHMCVTGGTGATANGYTEEDITDMNIQACSNEYEAYDNKYDAWADYACIEQSNGTESCGETALSEQAALASCEARMETTISLRDAYKEKYDQRVENSIQVIEWEHMQRPVAEDKEQTITVTAHLNGGGVKVFTGVVGNYVDVISEDLSISPRNITASVTGGSTIAGETDFPGISEDVTGTVPSPVPINSMENINIDIENN